MTIKLFREWLKTRYSSVEALHTADPGYSTFEGAYPVNDPSQGGWNNFQEYDDWVTFSCHALAEQVLFISEVVREMDPAHPVSCTPPDVLHNQVIADGRNMWWLADAVDIPSHQMELHWHLETADMPQDVFAGEACSLRKVYCSARGHGISCDGEFLAGPDLGESPRLVSTTTGELLGTDLMHLAEGPRASCIGSGMRWRKAPMPGPGACATWTARPASAAVWRPDSVGWCCGTTICCMTCVRPTRTSLFSTPSTQRSICTAVPASNPVRLVCQEPVRLL